MSVIRAFIAIDLSPAVRRRLQEVNEELKRRLEGVPVRWVPVENIHLTLKFLGDVSQENLEVLKKVLRIEAGNQHPFNVSVAELGAFPSPRRPRVIWVGVAAPPDLAAIQRQVEAETSRIGYSPEDRPFSPHLTLGRVSRNATYQDTHRIGEVLGAYAIGLLGTTQVQAINLYKSDLKPGGAIYTCLYSAPFSMKS